jgi:hypothetical protein
MAKKPKSPQFVARKIVITSHPKAPWRVFFPVEENGVTRRKRRMFSTEEKAPGSAAGKMNTLKIARPGGKNKKDRN